MGTKTYPLSSFTFLTQTLHGPCISCTSHIWIETGFISDSNEMKNKWNNNEQNIKSEEKQSDEWNIVYFGRYSRRFYTDFEKQFGFEVSTFILSSNRQLIHGYAQYFSAFLEKFETVVHSFYSLIYLIKSFWKYWSSLHPSIV